MPTLANVTLEQLRAATVIQIRTFINDKINAMSKKGLICFILRVQMAMDILNDDSLEVPESPVTTYHPDGQIASKLEQLQDVLGINTQGQRITWSYYLTGEVDEIVIEELDAAAAVVKTRTIKHYTDGTQPMMSSYDK